MTGSYLDRSGTINFFKWEENELVDSYFEEATHVKLPYSIGCTTTTILSDRIKEILRPYVTRQQIITRYFLDKVLCEQIPSDVEQELKYAISDLFFDR